MFNFKPIFNDDEAHNHNSKSLLKKLDSKEISEYVQKNEYFNFILKKIDFLSKNKLVKDIYISRLREELEFYIKYIPNFAEKLTLFSEMTSYYSKKNILANIGRGSSPASLVCYLLDITKIDPVVYNLNWHRFLGTEDHVKDALDIDIDIPNRDELILYLKKKYPKKVYLVGIENIFTLRGSLSNMLKSNKFGYKISHVILNEFKKELNFFVGLESEKNKFITIVKRNDILKEFFEENLDMYNLVLNKIGSFNNYSIHAAGLFFSDKPLDHLVVNLENRFDLPVAFVDRNDPFYYFNKIDFLNLKILSKNIELKKYQNIDFKDIKIFEKLNNIIDQRDNESKYFQSKMMTDLSLIAPNFSFKTMNDISHYVSFCRPDAIKGYTFSFEKEVVPKRFKKITKDTNGHILYQEQIMACLDLCKMYSLLYLKKFAEKTITYSEVESDMSKSEFDYLFKYACMAFNKAHAISYSHYTYLDVYLANK